MVAEAYNLHSVPAHIGAGTGPGLAQPSLFPNTISPQKLRDFYDPQGLYHDVPLTAFLAAIASSRSAQNLHGGQHIDGYGVILAEAAHCLLDDGPGIELPLSESEQRNILRNTKLSAYIVADCIRRYSDDFIAGYQHRKFVTGANFESLPLPTVLDYKFFAAIGHNGIYRRNDRPYYTHPEDVATIGRLVWDHLGYDRKDPLYTAFQAAAYGHDVPEDTIDAAGTYIQNPVPTTPLVARTLLELRRFGQAADTAQSLVALMRVKGYVYARDSCNNLLPAIVLDPVTGKPVANQLPYVKGYITQGLAQPGFTGQVVTIVKRCDLRHNRHIEADSIDGDPRRKEKVRHKQQTYDDATIIVIEHADGYPVNAYGTDIGILAHTVGKVDKQMIRRESSRNYPFGLAETARSIGQSILQERKREGL